ncbi:hypothetical protein BIZ35_11015 [Heyndrickxia coagulans]|nr:hypothetical protein BIZ35_11015 [Heyndrickxia coagulans]
MARDEEEEYFPHCCKPFAETGGENANLLIGRIKQRGIHHGMTGCARQSGRKSGHTNAVIRLVQRQAFVSPKTRIKTPGNSPRD